MDREQERLRALDALNVLDTPPEAEFDVITSLAARLFDVPVALLSLVDEDRQWFKSRHGTDLCQTERNIAFCHHTIQADEILEVADAARHPMFADNPLVTGNPGIRYYAGAPLRVASGHRIGTLCLIDLKPRPPLDPVERALLDQLAQLAVVQLELRSLRLRAGIAESVARVTTDAFIIADRAGLVTQWNPAAEQLFGYPASEMIGQPLSRIIPEELRDAHRAGFERMMASGERRLNGPTVEVPALCRSGERIPVELSLAVWTGPDGLPGGVGAIIRDLTARKRLEAEKAEAQHLLTTVVEKLPAMLFVKVMGSRKYLLWNDAAAAATGWSAEQVIGRTDAYLFGEEGVQFMRRDSEADRAGAASVHESRFTRPDGSECVLRTTRAGVPGENGRPALMLGMSEDVTQWRAAQERLAFLAGHDALTHLHNRVSFAERLEAALDGGAPAALLAIDLDRFKAVNDTHGHLAGDELLIAVAKLLREIGETDEAGGGIAARMAGDEFMLLLPGPRAGARAARIAQRLVDRLGASVELGPVSVRSGASIGIAVAPEHGRTAEELLRSADLALYRAKGAGRGRYSFFDNDMDEAARQRWRIEGWMREAIAAGQFRLEYQPLASLESGKVVAFEALARWRHPEGGDIRPDIFIPIAEESGLILELGRQMLRQAVAEAARWQPELTVSVNLSPIQVQNPVFYDHVAEALAEFGLAPERLELEVTEGVLIRDPEAALATLNRLKALGVSIAIDDFGTGYSSLSYFRMFPFDKVKIDQSFVREMEGSHEALAIVQAVIGLARGLGLPVVAEGVESQAQFDLLLAEGCTQVQGYLLGRPAPAEAFRGVVIRPDAERVRATG